jgi:hypothetical protein
MFFIFNSTSDTPIDNPDPGRSTSFAIGVTLLSVANPLVELASNVVDCATGAFCDPASLAIPGSVNSYSRATDDIPYIPPGSTAVDILDDVPESYITEFSYYQNPKYGYQDQWIPQYKFSNADDTLNIRVHGGQKPFKDPDQWVVNVGHRVEPGTPGVNPWRNPDTGLIEWWKYTQNHDRVNTSLEEMMHIFEVGKPWDEWIDEIK